MAVYNPNTVAGSLAIAPLCGLPVVNFVPASLQSQCATVAARHVPPGSPSDWLAVATASLIARGIIYFKNVPGDCGSPTQVDLSNASAAGEVGQAALGIASMAGASLPGIGVAISLIQGIFAHHAQAVATEQKTICAVAGVINQVFAYYDKQVRNGSISPSSAYTGMQTFLSQVDEQLATIYQSCNASCVYRGILAAHADFVESYYPAIAPVSIFSHAPGGAPSGLGSVPGGVIQVGETVLSPVASAFGISAGALGLIVIALIALFAVGLAVSK